MNKLKIAINIVMTKTFNNLLLKFNFINKKTKG